MHRELTGLERLPPQNLDAERSVLACALMQPEVLDEIGDLGPDDFYSAEHAAVFRVMLDIHAEGKGFDLVRIGKALEAASAHNPGGWLVWLKELFQWEPTAANAGYYTRLVRDASTRRKVIHASTDLLRKAYEHDGDPSDLLSEAEERITALSMSRASKRVTPMRDVMASAMESIQSKLEGRNAGGMSTGFADLDKQVLLRPGELVIVAARPGMGKTALAANIAECLGVDDKRAVLFVTIEMPQADLAERMVCGRAELNVREMRGKNGATPAEHRRLIEASADIANSNISMLDSPGVKLIDIASTARYMRRRGGLDLIVVDYLQLIEPDNPRDPRQEQVSKISRRLKCLARELEVPVIVLAQLNREIEKQGTNRRPRLSHLRESGAIEQDADVVLFIHRDEYYATSDKEREPLRGKAEVLVAKQRKGPAGGVVPLTWQEGYTRFKNYADPSRWDKTEWTYAD